MLKLLKFWAIGVLVGLAWFGFFSFVGLGFSAKRNDPGVLLQLADFLGSSLVAQTVFIQVIQSQQRKALWIAGIGYAVLTGGLFCAVFFIQVAFLQDGMAQARNPLIPCLLYGVYGFVIGSIGSVIFSVFTFPAGIAGVWAMRRVMAWDGDPTQAIDGPTPPAPAESPGNGHK